jgi:hypothetical protein
MVCLNAVHWQWQQREQASVGLTFAPHCEVARDRGHA